MISFVDEDNLITKPEGWAAVRLIEAVTLQRGFDLPVQDRADGNVPIYAANGPVGTHNIARVKGPGVVTGRSGTIGKVHFIEADFWPLNTSLYVRDFHGNDPQFVALLLKTLELERYLAGTGVPTLNRNVVHEVVVTIPTFEEQQRIVAKVNGLSHCVEGARDHLSRVPAILKRFRQAVLAAACSGRLTEEWRAMSQETVQRDTRESLQPNVAQLNYETDKPELPSSWRWATVQQVASSEERSIQSGPFGSHLHHAEFQSHGVLAIGIDNVLHGTFSLGKQHRISYKKYETLKKFTARPRDVLITVMATIGRCCVIPENIERAIITKHVYRITVDQQIIEPHFLMFAFMGDPFVRSQVESQVRGQTRPGINGQILKSLVIPVPLPEQRVIKKRVEDLLALSDSTERRVSDGMCTADKLTQSILAKAFRGELAPTEAELARREGREYEPASVLLRRIKAERESQPSVKTERKGTQRRKAKPATTKG